MQVRVVRVVKSAVADKITAKTEFLAVRAWDLGLFGPQDG